MADAVSHCMARYFVLTCSVPLVTSGVGALMIAVVPLLTRQGMLVGALTAGRCPDDRCSVPLVTRHGMVVDDLMIGALSHWLLVTVCW